MIKLSELKIGTMFKLLPHSDIVRVKISKRKSIVIASNGNSHKNDFLGGISKINLNFFVYPVNKIDMDSTIKF